MSFKYARHDDVQMRVMPSHIKDAVCQSKTLCTLARAGQETLGVPVVVGYDPRTGKVCMQWRAEGRLHDGVLEPTEKAVQVLLLTDTDKRELVGACPKEGIQLTVASHRSRPDQARTQEQRDSERDRRAELARQRADRIAPPPVKRTPGRPVRRLTHRALRRGIAVTAKS